MTIKQTSVELKRISLAELTELTENEFTTSYPLQIPLLVQSIREVGLTQPLLVSLRNGYYQVVCGHRRFWACQQLGYTSIACLVLPDQSSLQLLQLAIQDNLSTRQLNPVEKANIICKLVNHLPKDMVICQYLPSLGLQPHYKILDKFLNIAQLKERVKQAIVSGRVHEEVAGQLIRWPAPDQIMLADIFLHIPLSTSSQQEVITNVWEISQREDIPLSDVLASNEIIGLLNDNSLNSSQKGHQLRRYLFQRRYPSLSSAEKRFRQYLTQLQFPQGTKLIPPSHFEGSKFRLECSFTSLEQLDKQFSHLSKTTQNPVWQDIFKLGTEHDP